MRRWLLAALALLSASCNLDPPPLQQQDDRGHRAITDGSDGRVYQAVIDGTVGREVDRFSAGVGVPTPAPVPVLDRSIPVCAPAPPSQPTPATDRCLPHDMVQRFADGPRNSALSPFLDDQNRKELLVSFRSRNRSPQPLVLRSLPRVLPLSSGELTAKREEDPTRSRGFVGLSLPGYSLDGHAFVYAFYVCGGLCGYGWFFVLERSGDVWRVVGEEMQWIS